MSEKEAARYPHPFSRSYWKDAAAVCTNLRSLTVAAILCALAIVIEWFQIPIAPPTLYISFSFLVISLCSLLTGPVLAVSCGILVDLIGFLIPIGTTAGSPFFPGYTLTAVLTAVIYALFLYRAELSFARIALAKAIINIFVNTLLGSCWRIVLLSKLPYRYHVATSGIKNLALLPLEVFLICIFFRAMQKPLIQLRLLPESSEFTFRKRDMILLGVLALVGAVLLAILTLFYDEMRDWIKHAL